MQQPVKSARLCGVRVDRDSVVPSRFIGQGMLGVMHFVRGCQHRLSEQTQHGQAQEKGSNGVQ
jgi:hypothetical protein